MNDIELSLQHQRNTLAGRMTDLAEQEQALSESAHQQAEASIGAQAQAIRYGERDKHTARTRAFLEAARLIMEAS